MGGEAGAVSNAKPGVTPTVGETIKKTGKLLDKIKGKTAVIGGSVDFSALKDALEALDPRMHHAIRLTLGVDQDGYRLDKPLSAQAAAEKAGISAPGKTNTEVSRVSNALGITKDVRNRFTSGNAVATERAEGDIGAPVTDVSEGNDTGPASTAEDATPVTSDEAFDEGGDRDPTFADAGYGVVSDVGGSQSRIEAAPKGSLVARGWYQSAVEGGLSKLSDTKLAEIVAKSVPYANDPDSRAALNGLMAEVRSRQSKPGFARLLDLAYDKEYGSGTDTKKSAAEYEADERARSAADAAIEDATEGSSRPDGSDSVYGGTGERERAGAEGDTAGDSGAPSAGGKTTPVVTVKKSRKAVVAKLQDTSNVLDGTDLVREVNGKIDDNLSSADQRALALHYSGETSFTPSVRSEFLEDVLTAINKGLGAVDEAVRKIVSKVMAAVLTVAMVFNPYNTSPAQAVVVSSKSYFVEKGIKLPDVPVEAAARMSPAAQTAYQQLFAGLKAELQKNDKLLIITDKPSARVFVFNPDGTLLLQDKVLIGKQAGDKLKGDNDIPTNRITPAGLFNMGLRDAARGGSEARTAGDYDFGKVFVLDKAIEGEYSVTLLHSVWTREADAKQRINALNNDKAEDSRYSFGCINLRKSTYKTLLDKHLPQMDGAKLFVVPDNQAAVQDFLSGEMANNTAAQGDGLTRQSVPEAKATPDRVVETSGATSQQDGADQSGNGLSYIERRRQQNRSGRTARKFGISRSTTPDPRTLTAKFKRWFGKSKIVDENGNPAQWYHGTGANISKFMARQAGAIFLTPEPKFAESFANMSANYLRSQGKEGGENIMPVFVKAENPFDFEDIKHVVELRKKLEELYGDNLPKDPMFRSAGISDSIWGVYQLLANANPSDTRVWNVLEAEPVQAAIKALGHDSFYVMENGVKNIGVYSSTQVKSVTGNSGEYGVGNEDISFGQDENINPDGTAKNPYTAEKLIKELSAFVRTGSLGNRVVVVDSVDDLINSKDPVRAAVGRAINDAGAFAAVENSVAYVIADRINKGEGPAKFLHEVGAHLGLEGLLGEKRLKALANQIRDWLNSDATTDEVTLANRAMQRVMNANTPEDQRDSELIAYFIEEAVSAGLFPTAADVDLVTGPLRQWFRTLWAAFKVAVRTLGIKPENLTAQNIVDLAYGAARLEVNGVFHGTAASFRRFSNAFMGKGEGAQAFGWGTYLAQSKGIANDYFVSEVGRKTFKAASKVLDGLTGDFYLSEPVLDPETMQEIFPAGTKLSRGVRRRLGQLHLERGMDSVTVETADGPVELNLTANRPKGNILRVDTAVAPDEMLDWDAPMSKQPAIRKKVEQAIPQDLLDQVFEETNTDIEDITGEDLYRGLTFLEKREGLVSEFAEKDTIHADAQQTVSEYLDSIGIKGLRYLDNPSRKEKDPAKQTRNVVIFNDRNIQRVVSRVGASRSDIKFGIGSATATANNANAMYRNTAERLRGNMNPKVADSFATVTDFLQKNSPRFLNNSQLAEQFGKKIDSLKKYVGLQQSLTVERTKQAMEFHDISVKWDKLAKAVKEQLSDVMLRATLKEIHPDRAFGEPENAHLKPEQRAEHAALAAKYNAMTPEAKKVYQEAKKALDDAWKKREAAYNQLVNYTYNKRIEAAQERGDADAVARLTKEKDTSKAEYSKQLKQIKGPYFPLMRFGSYLAIGESQALIDLRQRMDDATGSERAELEKQLDAMKKDGTQYSVSAHETKGQANAAERALKAKGLQTRQDLTDQHIDGMRTLSQDTLDNITQVIDSQFDKGTAGKLNESISSIFLQSLPEMHALRREAHRKGIEGASPDMLRAFAAAGQQGAFFTSRLMYASEMADTMFAMKRETKGKSDLQHIHREMEQRMALDMQYKPTPVQDLMSSLSWVYHLGVSPSFMLINSTQPWLVTLPMMAGKFGFAKATKALSAASRDSLMILKDARWKDGQFDAWSGISEGTLASFEDRKAIRELMTKGILADGAQLELSMFADDSSRLLSQANRYMGWTTQQIELLNRTSAALASFRLARKDGMGYDDAVKYAYDTTLNTQFDYSAEGAARVMREGGGVPFAKLVFQFRRYQQGMLYLLGSNIQKAFGDGKEAKEARAALTYFTITSGMAAGALGLPFMGTALFIANLFGDPDDPEGDAETRLRNALYDLAGDKKLADVLAKGLPALFGMDLSKRIGLGDIASPFPMARFDRPTGQEQVGELLLSALGPAAGLAAKFYDGFVRLSEGDVAKGIEKLSPKFVADVVKANRYATAGLTDGKNVPTGTELDEWDVTLRALGVAPTAESSYYEGVNAIKNIQAAYKDRQSRIGRAFKEGVRSGDMGEAREMIQEFNKDHPEQPITGKQELQWRKDVRNEGKNRAPGSGVPLMTKSEAYMNRAGRFAQ